MLSLQIFYSYLLDHIGKISAFIASLSVAFLLADLAANFSPIPRYYYTVPKEGDGFPVHGSEFWALIGAVFIITLLDSLGTLLYGIWRWKTAYSGKVKSNGTILFTVSGMEIFLTITRTLLVILSIGHLLFLLSNIIARAGTMIFVIYAKPFQDSPVTTPEAPPAAMYSRRYKKMGYSSL